MVLPVLVASSVAVLVARAAAWLRSRRPARTRPGRPRWLATRRTGLVVRELRVVEPFIDPRAFVGNVPVLATFGRNLLTYVVSYAFIYGFTQCLEGGRGPTATQAGLVLLPMFLTAIVVSAVTGRRRAVRGKLVVGSAAQNVACALLLRVHTGSGIWLLVVVGLVVGVPQGLNSLANQNALYHQADPERIGASAGLLRTFTYLGALVASAANGAFFGTTVDTTGLHELAAFLVGCAVLLLTLTLVDRSLRRVGRTVAVEGNS